MSNNIESKTSLEGRNHHLDVIKLLASMAVVFIHVVDNTTGGKYYKPVLDLAVPCFFMISGYLVGHRSQEYLKGYITSILKMYVGVSIFYWVVDYFVYTTVLGFTLTLQGYIIKYILPRIAWVNLLNGGIGKYHLWYLWASIIGFIIFKVLKKMNVPDWLMVLIGIVGYIVILLRPSQYIQYGGFLKAYVFITLGHLLHQRTTIKRDNKRFLALPIILGLVLTLPEIRMRSTIPFMVELMVFCTSVVIMYFTVTTYIPKNKITSWGSKVTDGIYLLHPLAIQIIVYTAGFEMGEGWYRTGVEGTYILYTMSFILTLLLVSIEHKLKNYVVRNKQLRT